MTDRVNKSSPPAKKKRKSLFWRMIRYGLVLLVIAGVAGRLYAPTLIRDYVNKTLDQSQLYHGKIGDIDLNIWRGAYAIHNVRLVKMTGDVPVPLFAADRVEFAIEWKAVLHGKVVGTFEIDHPELNFVDAASSGDSQTGSGGPWLQIIRDLFPFKINGVTVHDGSVHFRTYKVKEPVDIYISQLEATVDDLTNIQDSTNALLTTVEARGLAMDDAKFQLKVRLDPFSYRPTMHLAMRLIGLDVTKINAFSLAYGKFDFKRGWFDLVVEMDSKEGVATGYVKPLFRDLQVFVLPVDLKEDNPLQFFWQALVGGGTRILTNQQRNQFGTLVPFHLDESTTTPDILATIGNVLRNAFVRAYLPKFQNGETHDGPLQFDPPDLKDPTSAGD